MITLENFINTVFDTVTRGLMRSSIGRLRVVRAAWAFFFEGTYFLLKGISDAFETGIVKKCVKPGDTVVDIGAGAGYYTLIFARLVGTSGKVFAFEPDPSNFALLQRNVKKSGCQNVILVNKAVSDMAETVKLYKSPYHLRDHRTYDTGDGREAIAVDSIRLDDYFKNFPNKINFIKIDIQGAEWAAIAGMRGLLNKNKKLTLLTEFWPVGLAQFGIEPKSYLSQLQEHGFTVLHMDERKKQVMNADTNALLKTYTPENRKFTNLLCIRKNR